MGPKHGPLWCSLAFLKAMDACHFTVVWQKPSEHSSACCLLSKIRASQQKILTRPYLFPLSTWTQESEGKGIVKRWAHIAASNSIGLVHVVSYFTYVEVEVRLTLISTMLNVNLSTGQPGAKTGLQTCHKRSLKASGTRASPPLLYSECDGNIILPTERALQILKGSRGWPGHHPHPGRQSASQSV